MIPIRLELKNFLPYRSPDPIYFDGIHLACLTGQNGAGIHDFPYRGSDNVPGSLQRIERS